MANEQITRKELRTEIRWKTRDGKLTVGVNIFESLGVPVIQAIKEEEALSERFWNLHKPNAEEIKKYPGLVSVLGGLAILDQERHDSICAEIEAMREQINNHPDHRLPNLIRKRERLASDVAIFLECAHEAHVEGIEHASEHGFRKMEHTESAASYRSKAAEAQKILADFDVANPDVVAALAKAKAEATERFLACD